MTRWPPPGLAAALVLLAALAGWPAAAPAADRQPSTDESKGEAPPRYSLLRADYWLEYFDDAAKLLASPARWERGDWLDAALVGAATGGVFLLDEDIQDFWQDDVRGDGTDDAADVFQAFGDGDYLLPGLPALFVVGDVLRHGFGEVEEGARIQETALLAAEGIALSTAVSQGIKALSGRRRPFATRDRDDFGGPDRDDDSFPSGHSTRAWALAAVVASEYRHSPAIRVGAYTFATLTSLARINDNEHWASDVVLGGALGYFIGRFVYEENPFRGADNLVVGPMAVGDGAGLRLAYLF